MLLNYPIYPTVSPRIGKPLAMTPLPLTSNEVPRLQRASGWSQGRQQNSHQATASYIPHDIQQSSILEHPFHICITSLQPCCVTITAHLFGLHGQTPRFGPEAITRWKIGHKPPQTTPLSNAFSQHWISSFSL